MISCRDATCPRRTECACYGATGFPDAGGMVAWDATGCPHYEPRAEEERDRHDRRP